MNVLLLHGMGGKPAPDRIEALKEMGFDKVIAPHLNYRQLGIIKTFDLLREVVQKERIEIIVGNSRGGFYAYWLAEELGLGCLVFNPAIPRFFHNEKYHQLPKLCKQCVVVTGLNDECVSSITVLKYFKEKVRSTLNPVIQVEPELAHRVPIEYFRKGMMIYSDQLGLQKNIHIKDV